MYEQITMVKKLLLERVSDRHIFCNGHTFTKHPKSGYYFAAFNREGRQWKESLHAYGWRFYYGAIPEGFDVHHKTGDKERNDIEDLELLPRQVHRIRHNLEKVGYVGEYHDECLYCGEQIDRTKRPYAVFHTERCKHAYCNGGNKPYKSEVVCKRCGQTYHRDLYDASEYCPACIGHIGHEAHQQKKDCPVCGEAFVSLNGAPCHRKCKEKYIKNLIRQQIEKGETRLCRVCGIPLLNTQLYCCCKKHFNQWEHEESERRKMDIRKDKPQHVKKPPKKKKPMEPKWTFERCKEIALKYATQSEFRKYDHKAFDVAKRRWWLKQFGWLKKGVRLSTLSGIQASMPPPDLTHRSAI